MICCVYAVPGQVTIVLTVHVFTHESEDRTDEYGNLDLSNVEIGGIVAMDQTRQAGMIDVISFSTLMKAYLRLGHFAKGRALIEEMKKEGLQPNKVTFNEFINAMLAKGRSWGFKEIWAIMEEMQEGDVGSILLKYLYAHSDMQNTMRTMDLINTMDEAMDADASDVLLLPPCDAGRQRRGHLRHAEAVRADLEVRGRHRPRRLKHPRHGFVYPRHQRH